MQHQYHFERLNVWQEAVELTASIYEIARLLPHEEKYGLTSQLKRATLSVTANIAEGSTLKSSIEYSRFINIAYGSCIEVLNHVLVGKWLGYITEEITVSVKCRSARLLISYNR